MVVTPTTMPTTSRKDEANSSAVKVKNFSRNGEATTMSLLSPENTGSHRAALDFSAKPPRYRYNAKTSKNSQSQNLIDALRNLNVEPRIGGSQNPTPRKDDEDLFSIKKLNRQRRVYSRMDTFGLAQSPIEHGPHV